MKLLDEDLLKSFIQDVKEAVRYYDESPRAKHFRIEPNNAGLVMTVVWDRWDEFSEDVAERIGKRFCSLWGIAWSTSARKYAGIFEQASISYIPCMVDREDDRDRYFSPNVRIEFKFGSGLLSYNTEECYRKCSESLLTYINKITGESSIVITDNGEDCSVGNYFKYSYTTGKISRTGRLCVDSKESKEISKLVSNLLNSLSSFGVPLKSITVSGRNCRVRTHYFYAIGYECLLWSDFCADKGTYFRKIGVYFDL